MVRKNKFLILICYSIISIHTAVASYSFRTVIKYPFASAHYEYDSLGNMILIVDSLARFKPIKPIIFRTETESLYQVSATNDSGYAIFTFEEWEDKTPVALDNVTRMVIDFPNTDRVIRVGNKITFEHLKYSDIDFRRNPNEIEIVLPMTVTKDEFTIGDPSWLNVCNFAIMNDLHIGEDVPNWPDFGTNGWCDDTIAGQTNEYIQNNENIVAAINYLQPDFVVILGDVTDSGEKSEFKLTRKILGQLLRKPYMPIMENHDIWPYY